MVRLVLMSFLLLLSFLNIFRAPVNFLWYLSIVTSEFCWIFLIALGAVCLLSTVHVKYAVLTHCITLAAFLLFAFPLIGAYVLSNRTERNFRLAFSTPATGESAFSFTRIISGINSPQAPFETLVYDENHALALDFYPSLIKGIRPCVIVIHGGSWAGGNKEQLPELNSYLAKKGYHVAAINYRLAPENIYPAPTRDVVSAINYLRIHADALSLDSTNFVLLGRSAGAQIALDAAYTLKDLPVRGVISYYGPTDMVWGYANPANRLVLDSKKIMEDYLGGTYAQVPDQYIQSSATEKVKQGLVPTLLIQGKNDCLVAYDHCNRLDKKLTEFGITHVVLRLPWATHGCDFSLNGPSGQLATTATAAFLQNIFKKNSTVYYYRVPSGH